MNLEVVHYGRFSGFTPPFRREIKETGLPIENPPRRDTGLWRDRNLRMGG